MAIYEDLINNAYKSVLGREADQAGFDYWLGELNSGNIQSSDLQRALTNGALGAEDQYAASQYWTPQYNPDPNANLLESLIYGNEQNTLASNNYQTQLQALLSSGMGNITPSASGGGGSMKDFEPKFDAAYQKYEDIARPLIDAYGTMDQSVYDRMKGQYYAGLDTAFSQANDDLQMSLAARGLAGSGIGAKTQYDLAQDQMRANSETGVRAYNDAIAQSDINRSNMLRGHGDLYGAEFGSITGAANAAAQRGQIANGAASNRNQAAAINNQALQNTFNNNLSVLGLLRDDVYNNSATRLNNLMGYSNLGLNMQNNSNSLLGQAGNTYNSLGGLAGGTATTLGELTNNYNSAMNGAYSNSADSYANQNAGKGSLLGTGIGALGSGISSGLFSSGLPIAAFSDERLKDNIEYSHTENGINYYTWEWNDTAKDMGIESEEFGVIAQEIIETLPEAVTVDESGYYKVNYSMINKGV